MINLNPSAAPNAPKSTKNIKNIEFAKIRMGVTPLSSRNNWKQITKQADHVNNLNYEININTEESP